MGGNGMSNQKLRGIIRIIYHRLPFPMAWKLRIRARLAPVLRSLQSGESIGDVARQLVVTVTAPSECHSGKSDVVQERAIQKALAILATHSERHGPVTHWIALPFLATGGAHKVAVNISKALRQHSPGCSVVFLSTDRQVPGSSPEIPHFVAVLEFDAVLPAAASYDKKKELLLKLLDICRPECFHNINSEVAWHLLKDQGARVAEKTKVYASIFAFQYDWPSDRKIGYAAYYLESCMPYLTGLLSDNRRFLHDAADEYSFDEVTRERLHVLYQPCPVNSALDNFHETELARCEGSRRLRVLWAGRLDAEKRVDLLLDLVRRCDFADFFIFGTVVLDPGASLPALSNLHYEGAYDEPEQWFASGKKYDAFVFTSRWEGMPNTLLEAGAYRLPVVAPTVGGIGELVTESTGYPLPERPTVEHYLDALQAISRSPHQSRLRAQNMSALLQERHSWSHFSKAVRHVPGYLAGSNVPPTVGEKSVPEVSIIIPCYNQGRYLRPALSSFLRKNKSSLEVIIVDDGSTDPSASKYLLDAESLDPSSVRIVRKKNGGLSSARNAGLAAAAGEFVQFLDADDLITPGKIDAQVAHLRLRRDIDVSVCNFLLGDDGCTVFNKPEEAIAGFDLSLKDFLYSWERGFAIPIHCGLFRSSVLRGVEFDTSARAKEDWLFWTGLALSGASFAYVPGHWAIYRQHSQSMRRSYVNMGRAWLQAGLKIEQKLAGKEPLFFESVVSWFEQCYRRSPDYRREIARIQDSITASKGEISAGSPNEEAPESGATERLAEVFKSLPFIGGVPLFSVIVPVFNHFNYLEECLSSIAIQKGCSPFEVICVDDGSSDTRVTSLLRSLDGVSPSLKVVIHDENHGIDKTQKEAVFMAQGEFIAFVDCDDFLDVKALSVVEEAIAEKPLADYFFTDRVDVGADGKEIRVAHYGGYENIRFSSQLKIRDDLLDGMVASHLKVVRKKAYMRCCDYDAKYSGVQDWALALAIAEQGELVYLPVAVYRHRIHVGSVTSSDSVSQFRKANLVRRFFATRQLRDHVRLEGEPLVLQQMDLNDRAIQKLKSAWRNGRPCFAICETNEVGAINFLREFNSYFEGIAWGDQTIAAALSGYLWDEGIIEAAVPEMTA